MTDKILRIMDVIEVTKLSRPTIYNYMAAEIFPLPFRLGPNTVGWKESEIQKWIEEKASKRIDFTPRGDSEDSLPQEKQGVAA